MKIATKAKSRRDKIQWPGKKLWVYGMYSNCFFKFYFNFNFALKCEKEVRIVIKEMDVHSINNILSPSSPFSFSSYVFIWFSIVCHYFINLNFEFIT
jgi:hypothetical protein